MKKIKILFCSTEPVVLAGLKSVFVPDQSFNSEFVNNYDSLLEDLSLFDIVFVDDEGLKLLKFVENFSSQNSSPKKILFTSSNDLLFFVQILNSGFQAIVSKKKNLEEIRSILHQVHNGGRYYDENIVELILSSYEQKKTLDAPSYLSNREIEIYILLKRGYRNKQISRKLNLSVKTIETHKENIKRKLGKKHCSDLID